MFSDAALNVCHDCLAANNPQSPNYAYDVSEVCDQQT